MTESDAMARKELSEPTKLRWNWRTLVLTIPLHLLVFALLYFGGTRLVEQEVLRAHASDSEILLEAAVRNLHLVMTADPEAEVYQRLTELTSSFSAVELQIFDAAGRRVAGESDEGERDVAEALAGGTEERFWLTREGGTTSMHGLMRIRADETCLPCHEVGEVRGVASMRRDLSAQVAAVNGRLRFWVVLGIAVWIVVAGLVNRMMVRSARRSAEQVQADLDASHPGTPRPGVLLDPASAAIFESLARTLHDQRRREEHLADRMHHADRLASLGQLAAGLAHEIKNPLAGIQGALEILHDEAGQDANRDVIEQMLAELKRIDATIRTLLRFGRPSPPRRSETAVAGLLEETAQLLRPGLLRKSIAIELETAPELGSFLLDPEQIRQVLVNLISNAAEAIGEDPEKSGGRIVVRASPFPQGDGIIVAVEDDGPGIDAEAKEKIFQPFFSTKFTGTGLGLTVVDSLVTQHGGRLEVESTPGRGSTFFVMLPDPVAEKAEES